MKYHTHKITVVSIVLLLTSVHLAYAMANAIMSEEDDGVKVTQEGVSGKIGVVAASEVKLSPTQLNALKEREREDAEKKESETKMEDGMNTEGMEVGGMEHAKMSADEHAMYGLETATLHVDVEALMKEENKQGHGDGEAEIDAPEKVHSSADFEHFVAHKAKVDAHIKDVKVKDGKVEVTYEESAKLFGFINTTLHVRASMDREGKAEVAYPWYHIFMKKHVSRASIESKMAQAIAAERKGEKEGIASTTMRSTIVAALGIPNIFELIANSLKEASAGE